MQFPKAYCHQVFRTSAAVISADTYHNINKATTFSALVQNYNCLRQLLRDKQQNEIVTSYYSMYDCFKTNVWL